MPSAKVIALSLRRSRAVPFINFYTSSRFSCIDRTIDWWRGPAHMEANALLLYKRLSAFLDRVTGLEILLRRSALTCKHKDVLNKQKLTLKMRQRQVFTWTARPPALRLETDLLANKQIHSHSRGRRSIALGSGQGTPQLPPGSETKYAFPIESRVLMFACSQHGASGCPR